MSMLLQRLNEIRARTHSGEREMQVVPCISQQGRPMESARLRALALESLQQADRLLGLYAGTCPDEDRAEAATMQAHVHDVALEVDRPASDRPREEPTLR